MKVERVKCSICGVAVSSPFQPMKTPKNPEGEFILRAFVVCPECVEANERVNWEAFNREDEKPGDG